MQATITEVGTDQRRRPRRDRNCAFLGVNNSLDSVEVFTEHGVEEIEIPAIYLTNYWGILKFMYLNANRSVPTAELCKGVECLMEDETDMTRWEHFKFKSNVRTVKSGAVVDQAAQGWEDRLITNARNLCRVGGRNAYGRRLIERGHVMRYETSPQGEGFFVLHTKLTEENLAKRKRGRKPKFTPSQG